MNILYTGTIVSISNNEIVTHLYGQLGRVTQIDRRREKVDGQIAVIFPVFDNTPIWLNDENLYKYQQPVYTVGDLINPLPQDMLFHLEEDAVEYAYEKMDGWKRPIGIWEYSEQYGDCAEVVSIFYCGKMWKP